MRIQCDRERFLRAFLMAASVAPTRSPKPILQNVKLTADSDGVTLMGTDLEVGIRVDVSGVDVEAEGSAVLPVVRVGLILRETSDEKLLIESDGQRIKIEGRQSKFQLPAQDPIEFPNVSGFNEEWYHEMPARFFRELIHRTIFATDPESSRYALGGVLLELGEEEIVAVSTDGRRLARQIGPVKTVHGKPASEGTTIVPTKAMHLIERALAENDDEIRLAARDNEVLLKSQRTTIYARLVEGRYPNWRGVFPRNDDAIKLEMAVGPFYAAVRQAAIVTDDNRRAVEFTFGDGKLSLSGHGAELGESHVEVPIAYEGPEVSVRLDPRYVNEFLKVLEPDQTVTVELKDAETAVICSTADGYSYVVMPLTRNQ
jgi:DNA polymerase III subunit beta